MNHYKIVFTLLLLSFSATSTAQLGIGNASPEISSVLDISSTNKGLLVPRINTLERNLIVNPAEGLLIYNTDELNLNAFTQTTGWKVLASAFKSITIPTSDTTSSIVDTTVSGMTIIPLNVNNNNINPLPGTYLVTFNSECHNLNALPTLITGTFSICVNGVPVPDSIRNFTSKELQHALSLQTIVTVTKDQTVEIKWHTDSVANPIVLENRTLTLMKVK